VPVSQTPEIDDSQGIFSAGFNDYDVINNLGTVYVLMLLSTIVIFSLPFLYVLARISKVIKRLFDKLWQIYFWNGFILFFVEAYLEFMIVCCLTFEDIQLSELGLHGYYKSLQFQGRLSCMIAVFMTVVLIYLPIKITLFTKAKAKEIMYLRRNDFDAFKQHEAKYGSMHESLNLNNPFSHY
jgi:hypothetical protein